MRLAFALVALTSALLTVSAGAQTPPKKHSLDDTEVLVKQALAATLKVEVATIAVESREARRWPDADLGCAPRKGIVEPVPTDGFGFILTHAGKRYVYRADTFGRVRQCPPRKPRAPSPR
ncbi:MAG: hypothetical protein ABI880_03065 [Acidobacteriota bacterium]